MMYYNYLDKVVNRLLQETKMVKRVLDVVIYPPWIIDDNEGIDLSTIDMGGNKYGTTWNLDRFKYYVMNMYGLTNVETAHAWSDYVEILQMVKYETDLTKFNKGDTIDFSNYRIVNGIIKKI